MPTFERQVNKLFVRRLAIFLVALGVLAGLVAASPLGALSWLFFVELSVVGALVLYKLSVPARASDSSLSPLKGFLKSVAIYHLPVSILWVMLNAQLFFTDLPRAGIAVAPQWPPVIGVFGVLSLGKLLLKNELARLPRPQSQ